MKISNEINKTVEKKDHKMKMNGSAEYIADMDFEDMVYGKIVRSTCAHGLVKEIKLPVLPKGYEVVDESDISGNPYLRVITSEQPIFATEKVRYIGESILMITGPDKKILSELADQVEIIYEELEPVLSVDESKEYAAAYSYVKGDFNTILENADEVIEETLSTGYQEQAYIEPQGMVGIYKEGKVSIYGSLQCPFYIKNAVMQAMELEEDQVQIVQTVTGGAFGGKEDYPSLIGCQVAIAAKKTGRPVQLILNRREDMFTTTKRHPAKLSYKVALKNNKITGLKVDITLDAGAYAGLSSVVLQRALIAAAGVYNIENLDISGKAALTNMVSNGAFRGFGAPQSFYGIEVLMTHLANKMNMNPVEFRKQYLIKQYDKTPTNGMFRHYVPLEEMIERAEVISDFSNKYNKYQNENQGRFRKGIGLSIFLHGCGFTGSAEKDFIQSTVKLRKYEDDTVEILVGNTDMGQGLKTTFSKIVAKVLDLPYEQIIIVNPDTDRVPDSGPTVASRSLMIVGKLLERAAEKLKKEWVSKKEIEITEHYQHPEMIPWDMETFQGDAYPTYSYGLNIVEVETDMLTGITKLTGVWGIYDIGKVIDDAVMKGQADGGMLQGLGYGSIEYMVNKDGKVQQSSFTDYMIPTAKDTVPFEVEFIDNPYEGGPFGAKGAGELTIIGAAPAYQSAVELAIGNKLYSIPVTPEKVMEVI